LHIARSYSISFQLLELGGARLDDLRKALSPGQGVLGNHTGAARLSRHGAMLCSAQI